MSGQTLNGTCRTCIIVAALLAGLSPNAQLAGQVARNDDMVGNVWQWTEDCYADKYATAPINGSAAESPDGCMRVDRGSCWLYPNWLLRSATGKSNPRRLRDVVMGFRVARTLP